MKTLSSLFILVTLIFTFAFAEDGMEFGLRKIRHRKKVPKTNVEVAKSPNLGHALNLKAKSVKTTNTKKVAKLKKAKSKKYKDVNEMFANVEYNTDKKRKRPSKEDVFSELQELSDLDQVDKYEQKFVKAEGKRAKTRRKTKKEEAFVATNSGLVDNSFSNQAGGSNLKNVTPPSSAAKPKKSKAAVAGTVKGTTFDIYEDTSSTQEIMPAETAQIRTEPKAKVEPSTVYESVPNSFRSKPNTWLTLAPVGGYGVVTLTDSTDNVNRGAGNWEASDSFIAGVLADMGRGRWQFETGLLYVRNGIKREVNQLSLYGTGDNFFEYVDRDYIAVPLVGIFNFMDRSASSMFAKAGIWPMFMTSARQEIYSMTRGDYSGDVANLHQKYEILATLGVGGRIKVSDAMAIVIEGYFLRGLSDTFSTNAMSGTTQGFMGNVGISFDL